MGSFLLGGFVALLLGGLPFLFLDATAGSPDASFALLGWFAIGPPICFVVLPLAKRATARLGRARYLVFPGLGTLLILALAIAAMAGEPADASYRTEDFIFLVLETAMIWISWFLYLRITE